MSTKTCRTLAGFALATLAAVGLAGCTASATHASRPAAATSASMTSAPATSPSVTSPAVTSPAVTSPSAPTPSAGRVADPANYHVGVLGPGDPQQHDASSVSFQTPSHNIACTTAGADQVVCEIKTHTFADASRPGDCTLNWLGSTVSLDTSKVTLGVCAGNPIVLQDSTVLPYGYRLTFGEVSCTSSASGLTCAAGSNRFTLNRAAADLHQN